MNHRGLHPYSPPTVLVAMFPPRPLYQNSPHGIRRGREKVPLTIPLLALPNINKPNILLVHQNGGKQTSSIDIVGMHVRRSPVKLICEQRIRADFVGTDVSVSDLEKAHLQGIDIKKLVDALCLAKRTEQSITWQQLVATELDTANLGRKFSGNSLS